VGLFQKDSDRAAFFVSMALGNLGLREKTQKGIKDGKY